MTPNLLHLINSQANNYQQLSKVLDEKKIFSSRQRKRLLHYKFVLLKYEKIVFKLEMMRIIDWSPPPTNGLPRKRGDHRNGENGALQMLLKYIILSFQAHWKSTNGRIFHHSKKQNSHSERECLFDFVQIFTISIWNVRIRTRVARAWIINGFRFDLQSSSALSQAR